LASRWISFFQWIRLNYQGYLAAVLGDALATILIALVISRVHVENISLVYLLVVLGLAAYYGRGPAIAASILAFLAYDFYFIPPVHVLTVNDPSEWFSLLALLATSLVIGQLTAVVQARAHEAVLSRQEAVESEQRTAILYALAQTIASTTDLEALLQVCAARIVEVFHPNGITACSLIVPDIHGWPVTRAIFPAGGPGVEALNLSIPERAAQAVYVLEHGTSVGGSDRHQLLPGAQGAGPVSGRSTYGGALVFYLPLRSSQQIVGVVGIAGSTAIRQLRNQHIVASHASPSSQLLPGAERSATAAGSTYDSTETAENATEPAPSPAAAAANGHLPHLAQQVALFTAFCDQIALAIDRFSLQQQAIHAEALRESDQLKNALLGSVTHDLRTPLAAIQASVGSLLEAGVSWTETERREFLETIESSSDRLSRLVNNLLDLSRLEAGVAEPEKQWYPIENVIATVLDRLELAGRTGDYHIDIEVPDNLPVVPIDHAQIEQVLTNLIENALKYSPAGSTIQIKAETLETPAREVEVRVTDQGIGIASHELKAIFDKFYRVQQVRLPWANNRPPSGTGLGLAICAGIVQAHGGRIWAESQPGKGSTFIFTLPIPEVIPPGDLPELPVTSR
jgi:two-component system sensor histidine kinase KdpD